MRVSRGLVIALIFLAVCLRGLPAPAQDTQGVPESGETQAASAPKPNPDWQRELDAITDLLIDGKSAEAEARAAKLLRIKDLPDSVAARARELWQKAEAKLAATPASPEPRKKIEISGEDEKPQRSDSTFNVRLARIGGGFESGTSGLLRISEAGLAFVRKGRTGENWTIRWSHLAEVREDDGLWDAPYPPILLVERSGRRHYIVQVDAKGRHLPGSPLLSAIVEGRRRQKSPKKGTVAENPEAAEPRG